MSTETITSNKIAPLQSDAVTKEIASTYDVDDLVAMGWPAQVAILLVDNGDTDNLMALGIPARAAIEIATDN